MNPEVRALVDKEKELMFPAVAEHSSTTKEIEIPQNSKSEFNNMVIDTSGVSKEISEQVTEKLKEQTKIDKHTKKLTKVGDKMLKNAVDEQENIALYGNAKNKADKQAIKNRLYQLKQEKVRLIKQEKFLNKQQKDEHRKMLKDTRWTSWEKTLVQYGFKEMPNMVVCSTILVMDAIKGFFEGVDKVNNKVAKAMKFAIIAGIIYGILMAIPSTRIIVQQLLGI